MKLEKLTMQIKPVGNNCNMRCNYCYALPFRNDRIRIMDLGIVEKIVKEAFEITDNVIITWHGGEPTIPGVNFYRQYMKIVSRYKKEGQNIVNMIQTNATLIDEEFAMFFKENKFIVSVSIDGNEKTHNRNRHYDNINKNAYQDTIRGVRILRKYGIYPPVIATVSKSTYLDCEDTFESLVNQGFKEIKYSPVYDSAEDEFSISSEEWYEYIKKVLNLWIDKKDKNIRVREIDEVLTWFLSDTINTCSSNNACINWFSISENGDIYPCEYLRYTENYGNIKNISLEEVFHTEAYKRFVRKVLCVPKECKSCEFYKLCGNGCPATRIKDNKLVYDGIYVYCEERKKLYLYLKEIMEQ